MSAADKAARYAGLVAIESGIAEARRQASEDLAAWADQSGLRKGAVETPIGPVTLKENPASESVVVSDEAAFLAWAKANHAEAVETVERLRAADRAAILADRFVAVAGDVVDRVTGEPVPFAQVYTSRALPPTPTYGASDAQRQAKKAAKEWALAQADAVLGSVQASLEGTAE